MIARACEGDARARARAVIFAKAASCSSAGKRCAASMSSATSNCAKSIVRLMAVRSKCLAPREDKDFIETHESWGPESTGR